MSRDWLLFLEDMRDSSDRILRQTAGRSYERWVADEVLFDATVRNLTVLGEAAKQVPEGVRERYPDVPWAYMARMRDVLVHAYFGLKPEILWDVVASEVPALSARLRCILAAEQTHDDP